MAELLLSRGADINFVPDYTEQTPLEAAGSTDTRRGVLVDWLREQGAPAAKSREPPGTPRNARACRAEREPAASGARRRAG